jgi:hypothetical protein
LEALVAIDGSYVFLVDCEKFAHGAGKSWHRGAIILAPKCLAHRGYRGDMNYASGSMCEAV